MRLIATLATRPSCRFRLSSFAPSAPLTILPGYALADRIPLYIPPYVIAQANVARYNELQLAMNVAFAAANYTQHAELKNHQTLLTSWQPLMQHSIIEEAGRIVFHSQLIADFNTIYELGSMMLEELEE
ncbi:hypothetical protein [Hyphomicrobium sp. 2TAF46]|uniref:hypothetical protein n=1 Tax=Hyphomicrobium sp. 2TAF46 TaxID=3233019 RepID=UPI003F91C235